MLQSILDERTMELMKKNISKPRQSNLELYRCIIMFLIVSCHYGLQTELKQIVHENQFTTPSNFYYLINMWGKIGINCFLMITGYFMCLSHITLRKFLKLYLQVIFYSLTINGIFVLAGRENLSLVDWALLFLPFKNIVSDNFTDAFLAWWLFIPFLNILIKGMDERMHRILIGYSVLVFTIIDFLPEQKFSISVNPICWFSVIYMVASYIRLYPKHIWQYASARFWGGILLICVLIDIASVFGIIELSHIMGRSISPFRLVVDSNAPMALLTSIASFMFFKNIKVKYNKGINIIGSTTFGILLIHSQNISIRQWLWQDVFDCVGHYAVPYYWAYAIVCIFIVYFSCSVIDYIRICTIEKWTMSWLDNKIFKRNR